MYKTPPNKEIAALLKAIADSLEIRSVDEFRVRAFRGGARNVEKMEIDVADAVSEGRLDILPGIGKRLGAVIDEYVRTGASTDLEEAQEGIPPGLFEVLEIRGLGPKTVGKLFDELKIDGVDSLEQMAASGELRSLPGMGPKKVEKILLEIEKLRARRGRRLLADSLSVAQPILAKLPGVEGVAHAALSGRGEARRTRGRAHFRAGCGRRPGTGHRRYPVHSPQTGIKRTFGVGNIRRRFSSAGKRMFACRIWRESCICNRVGLTLRRAAVHRRRARGRAGKRGLASRMKRKYTRRWVCR